MPKTILHIGSNKDNRIALLTRARLLLSIHVGTIVNASPIYETSAWGLTDQDDFLNQAVKVDSLIDNPEKLLSTCQWIETQLGRVKTLKWGPRRIDIDIIFIGNLKIDSEALTIPHPYYKKRAFVLYPLADIIPNYLPIDSESSISELVENFRDDDTINIY